MGHYAAGDIVLAPIRFRDRSERKVRPAVVVAAGQDGLLTLCPVSSKPPEDTPSVSLSLSDFEKGGLDIFDESYVLTSYPCTVRNADVIAKKGCLARDSFAAIAALVRVGPPRR
jgi:mRNA interferase MazF